jgi:hypothetical protein
MTEAVRTYPILRLLTDEEVERMLSVEYRQEYVSPIMPRALLAQLGDDQCCPLGVALRSGLRSYNSSPTPTKIAELLRGRPGHDGKPIRLADLIAMAKGLTDDVDNGRIAPEALPEIVRASREEPSA